MCGLVPAMRILEAPMALAVSRVTKPIGPAPNISTIDPTPTFPFLQAWTPTESGSSNAASSKET